LTHEEPKAEEEERSKIRRDFIEFLDTIKRSIDIERKGNDWKLDIKEFFGKERKDLLAIKTEFPLYQQSQACYAVNKFLEKHTDIQKIVGYKGEMHVAPTYQEFQINRIETMPLLTIAWVFTKWNGTSLCVHVMFDGNYVEFTVFGMKKDEKTLHNLSTEIKKWMKKHNFFRGEKLEYLPRGTLGFLEYRKITWDSIIIPKETKEKVMLNIIFMLNNEGLCKKHGIPWRRGILLAGIAGTGKTQLARVLCNIMNKNTTIIWATPKALYDEEKIKLLFDAARYFAPSLLIIEDIDFIGKSRDFKSDPITGELLTQLDGNAPNHGVFVLATTNRAELLDRALLERPSRFDVKLVFELPDEEHRLKMVKYFSVGKQFKNVTFEELAKMTQGFTGAYIQEVITYGTLLSLREEKQAIEMSHIKNAIKEVREKVKKDGFVR